MGWQTQPNLQEAALLWKGAGAKDQWHINSTLDIYREPELNISHPKHSLVAGNQEIVCSWHIPLHSWLQWVLISLQNSPVTFFFLLFSSSYLFLWNSGLSRTADAQCVHTALIRCARAVVHADFIPHRCAFWRRAALLALHAFQAAWLVLRLVHGWVTTQMFSYREKILLYSIFSGVQNWGNSWVFHKKTACDTGI